MAGPYKRSIFRLLVMTWIPNFLICDMHPVHIFIAYLESHVIFFVEQLENIEKSINIVYLPFSS